jgi:hypothetical protein
MRFVRHLALVILTPLLMAADTKPPSLQLEIALVAARDGGRLAAGELGWVEFRFRNVSKEVITIACAWDNGKGAGTKKLPPSFRDGTWYAGFAVADFAYVFVPDSREKDAPHWIPLAPPDEPMRLAPDETRCVRRLVQAPKTPGPYALRAKFNNTEAVRAVYTSNDVPMPLPEPIAVEAKVDKVEIGPAPEKTAAESRDDAYLTGDYKLDGYWLLSGKWMGYMGIALKIDQNRFEYWFYSDFKSGDEPTYPISGEVEVQKDAIHLKGQGHLYSDTWRLIVYKNQICLLADSHYQDYLKTDKLDDSRLLLKVSERDILDKKRPQMNAPIRIPEGRLMKVLPGLPSKEHAEK